MEVFLCTSQRAGRELAYVKFELNSDGELYYSNQGDGGADVIKRRVFLSDVVLEEVRLLVQESNLFDCSDRNWPEGRSREGQMELGILLDGKRVRFFTSANLSATVIATSKDAAGLMRYNHLCSNLRVLFTDLLALHFKSRPVK